MPLDTETKRAEKITSQTQSQMSRATIRSYTINNAVEKKMKGSIIIKINGSTDVRTMAEHPSNYFRTVTSKLAEKFVLAN